MERRIRTLRHYRQRFEPGVRFVWRRPRTWMGKEYAPGDAVPESLLNNRAKLEIFWENEHIEIAQFEEILAAADPETQGNAAVEMAEHGIELPEGARVDRSGSWYEVTLADGRVGRLNGRAALVGWLADPPEADDDPDDTDDGLDVPEGVSVEENGGGWYTVTFSDGTEEKVRGEDALREFLADLEE